MQTTYSISVAKASKDFAFDLDTLPAHVVDHIVAYGLRQIMNDSVASAKTESEAEGLAQKRYDNLLAGTLRAAPNREGNPVRAEAMRLAVKAVEKAIVKKGEKVKDHTSAAIRARAAKAVETNPAWMVQAKVNVEAVAEMEIDD